MYQKRSVFVLALLCFADARAGDSLDDLISSVFGNGTETKVNTDEGTGHNPGGTPSPGVVTGPNGCVCVAYYLCRNGTINKDGTDIIDIR